MVFRLSRSPCIGAILAISLCGGPTQADDSAPHGATAPDFPYVRRGDEVDARYRAYREHLERFFDNFLHRLETEAPELRARLNAARPVPLPYGYQILPELVPDPPRTSGASRISHASYSWRRTGGFIERDLGRLQKLEAKFEATAHWNRAGCRRQWEEMVDEYRALAANQKLIASHIEYNRLWQSEIARRRAGYDVQTVLYDSVFERQALLDALQAGDQVLEPDLRAREQALFARIYEATHRVSPPDFLRVERLSSRHWSFRVPVYTDIEYRPFVEAFRSAVESAWHVADGDGEFRVTLGIHYVPATRLYADGTRPLHGGRVDIESHIRRFPPDGAVLTTGANTTHVLGRGIIVGPQDISPNLLAHEFGHILGFGDGYFRGYRDLGPEGFEVVEVVVVVEPDDFMSAPGAGPVGRQRFQHLLEARRNRSP
ncbi:MAG TPA: hypothetical protein VGT40_04950 [Methylomirabilota bacterium]|jgi:hypothetical protein|nr:hypothetical protein [Methylomirabilota bacterium]